MREILFRGQTRKRIDKVNMLGKPLPGKWVYGGIRTGSGNCSIIYGGEEKDSIERHVVYSNTVGQYTGLTDMHGKRIFEGDIVRLTQACGDEATVWIAVVEFGNPNSFYSWGWQLRHISGETGFNKDILLWCDMEETGATCEIVGNIHDGLNPALEAENGNPADHA